MKNQNFTIEFAQKFKKSYAYKMGGSQSIMMPNGELFNFDDREYYSGRGIKYNKSISHQVLGIILVTKKEVSMVLKQEKERSKRIALIAKEAKLKAERIAKAEKEGIYNLVNHEYGNYIELSQEEENKQIFSVERLAKTLDISLNDASLLFSTGKTYVFAKQKATGKMIMLYHASLSCNSLSISVDYNAETKFQEFTNERGSWVNAPYSNEVGQTEEINHFVC